MSDPEIYTHLPLRDTLSHVSGFSHLRAGHEL
jgi:hypothetical protein